MRSFWGQADMYFEQRLNDALAPLTWWSLGRILLWTIVFLFAAAYFAPVDPDRDRQVFAYDQEATSMLLSDGTIAKEPIQVSSSDGIDIVWVSDSSGVTMMSPPLQREDDARLPLLTVERVSAKSGQPVAGYYYLFNSMRILDMYVFVADALHRDPDLLVVTLNPGWVFSPYSIFAREESVRSGSSLWLNPRDIPLWFGVLSPADHAANVLSSLVPQLFDAARYHEGRKTLQRRVFGSPVPSPRADSGLFYNFDSAVAFWMSFVTDRQANVRPDDMDQFRWLVRQWQADILQRPDVSEGSFSSSLLERMLARIESSGVPTLLYLAPLDPAISGDVSAMSGYAATRALLQDFAQNRQGSTVRILVDLPEEIVSSMVFWDTIHTSHFGVLDAYLADEILRLPGVNE